MYPASSSSIMAGTRGKEELEKVIFNSPEEQKKIVGKSWFQ